MSVIHSLTFSVSPSRVKWLGVDELSDLNVCDGRPKNRAVSDSSIDRVLMEQKYHRKRDRYKAKLHKLVHTIHWKHKVKPLVSPDKKYVSLDIVSGPIVEISATQIVSDREEPYVLGVINCDSDESVMSFPFVTLPSPFVST